MRFKAFLLFAVVLACLSLAVPAHARTIHLIGDSISRGWALGAFEPSATNYLYLLRSPFSIGNVVSDDNGLPLRWSNTLIAVNDTQVVSKVHDLVVNGTIKPTDIVVIEDAGDHGSDPVAYKNNLHNVLTELDGISKVFTMTMFDYSPAPGNSQFDLSFLGLTTNQAIQEISGFHPNVTCLDMNAKMDAYKTACYGSRLLNVMHSDGIHPNIWGTARMVGVILQALGYPMLSTRTLEKAVATSSPYGYMGPNSQYWNATVAQQFIRDAILSPTP